MRLTELLRKQAGGLKHEWHVAAAKARVQKLCGRDEAEGLSQARLAHEVEMFQRMRVAELVDEMAKELQERGGAEAGETVNLWRVSAMEKAVAGCSPLGIPRAGIAPEGHRFSDKEFEVLMAMWMGLPVGVRRACPTAQCRQQADIWGVHGGMTCAESRRGTPSEAQWRGATTSWPSNYGQRSGPGACQPCWSSRDGTGQRSGRVM